MEHGELNPSGELSLKEAEERVGFEILIPEYLPESYEFSHAIVYKTDKTSPEGKAYETVSLTYKYGENSIIITETVYEGSQTQDAAIMDPAEEVLISGTEGKYVSTRDLNLLNWKLENVNLTMTSSLEKNKLLKIAESMVVKK